MADRHGPLMTLRLGAITTVVASSPGAARETLGKNDTMLSERFVPGAVAAQPNPEFTLGWVPCVAQPPTYLQPSHSLDALAHLRHRKVQQLLNHIEKMYRDTGKPVDIGKMSFAVNLNVVSSALFSVEIVDPGLERAQEFRDIVSLIMEDGGNLNLSDYFPLLQRFHMQGIRRHVKGSYERLHEIFDEIINKRLEDRLDRSVARSDDFLDVLLDQCQKEGSDFDHQNIKPLILELFIAGSDAAAITIEWAMAKLLRICPGMPRAIRMVLLMVASLVQAFNWKLPGGILPDELNMEEKFGVNLKRAFPLCAIPN